MTLDWNSYSSRFEAEARRLGRSEQYVARCLTYARPLVTAGLPVVFDFDHLSALLGFQASALREALQNPLSLYSIYRIPKKRGGFRLIHEPLPSLRSIQEWILRFILDRCHPHRAATAFCVGRSIKQNAEPHLRQPMVLSLDLVNFFPSVGEAQVAQVFAELGYSPEVVGSLTSLTVVDRGLPQGAPTSPALSNLIMIDIDEKLYRYATDRELSYTRYADDITFSGRFSPGSVITAVRKVLAGSGFSLNEAKTRLMLRHERQEVTGVVVNQRLQAPRNIRRMLRQEIYYIDRFGLTSHEEHRPSLYANRRDHLRGVAEFILFLNPDDRDARNAIEVLRRTQ